MASRATLGLGLVLVLGLVGSAATQRTARAQDDDLCPMLAREEVSAALGVDIPDGLGLGDACEWQTVTDEGADVYVTLFVDDGPLDDAREIMPDGAELTIDGREAWVGSIAFEDTRQGLAAVSRGSGTDWLFIETTASEVDALTAARALMELAQPRMARLAVASPSAALAGRPQPCRLFGADELSDRLGHEVAQSEDSDVVCAWESAAGQAPASVAVTYDPLGIDGVEAFLPGGRVVDVAGEPAYLYTYDTADSRQAALAVDLGETTITISVVTPDLDADAAGVVTELFEAALGRGLVVRPEPSREPDGGLCSRLTPEGASAALGLDAALEAQDFVTACLYTGDGVEVYVEAMEVAAIDADAEAVGAEPVAGLGDAAWWSTELETLFGRQGELALAVAVATDAETEPEARLARARAIMEALLAP
jgi:hypothetical protein